MKQTVVHRVRRLHMLGLIVLCVACCVFVSCGNKALLCTTEARVYIHYIYFQINFHQESYFPPVMNWLLSGGFISVRGDVCEGQCVWTPCITGTTPIKTQSNWSVNLSNGFYYWNENETRLHLNHISYLNHV